MTVEVRGTYQFVPFGTTRATIVIASARDASSLQAGEDDVCVVRGNTADETVASIPLPTHRLGDEE
jgi:hypothetical protein